MPRRVRIAVDAMGGDFAPEEIVKGAVQTARQYDTEVILVGHLTVLDQELAKYETASLPVRVHHASESIPDGGNPILALRELKDASVTVANRLVKEGQADAVVSAGHTGAGLVASSIVLGRLEGLDRPACGGTFGLVPNTFFLDLGPSTNCTAFHLFQYAIIGAVYTQLMLGKPNPTVALLSNGNTEYDGNAITQQAYRLIEKSRLNFIGNIDGYQFVAGKADVVVADGFPGNVILKFAEGFSQSLLNILEDRLGDDWPTVKRHPFFDQLRRMTDITIEDAGLLLGVNGVSVLCHGRADALAVERAIQRARNAFEQGIVERIREALSYELARMAPGPR